MIFWYVYCLNFLKKSLSTSNHHRQGRVAVKQSYLRIIVSDMVKRQLKMCRFVLNVIRKWLNNTAHREVDLPLVCKIRLFLAGFIVLRITGGQNCNSEKNLPRARDA